jgi:hypothetical protein
VVTDDGRGIVKQIFIRDPDGYYVEIGTTHVLTKFCLGSKKYDAFSNKKTAVRSEDAPD